MAKFLMLGKYSQEAIKGISPERTNKAVSIIEKAGGKVNSAYALLGNYDLALLVDLPGNTEAMKVSIALTGLTGVSFTSSPAMTVEEFDKLVG